MSTPLQKRRIRPRPALTAVLVAILALSAACSSGTPDNSTSDVLTIGWPRGPETGLDKAVDHGEPGIKIMGELYAGLVTYSPDGRDMKPNLAEGWEISPDKRTYTFHLRPDIKFSDGSPIRGQDVVFSLEELQAEGTVLGYLLEPITSLTAPDDQTVVIELSQPYQPLLEFLALWTAGTVPENYGGRPREEFYNRPVSSGPWVLKSWTRGDELALEPNPHWYGPKPRVERVVFQEIADDQARILQLSSHQVDMIADPAFGSLASLRQNSDLDLKVYPYTNNPSLFLNNASAPLKDLNVRKAISLAIDREALAEAGTDGTGEPASSFAASALSTDPLPPLPFDLTAAKELMAQSAHPDGFPVGIKYAPTQVGARAMAQVLVQQLQPLGIDVELMPLEGGSFSTAIDSGDFEIAIYADLFSDVPDLAEFAIGFVGTGAFWTGSSVTEDVARLGSEAAGTYDDAERQRLYTKILTTVNDDASVIGLIQTPKIFVLRKGHVSGLDVNFLGRYDLTKVSVK